MTTAQDWVHETRRHLLSSDREQLNRLQTTMNSSVTSLVFEFSTFGGIREGAVIECESELMYVWSVSSTTATVQRGVYGSVAAAHTSGALITVNPRFPTFAVLAALNAELVDLCSPAQGLYRVAVEEIDYTTGVLGYDLSLDDYLGALELHIEADETALWWRRIDHSTWRIQESADPTDFASGRALILGEDVGSSSTLRLTYKRAFDTLSALTDDVHSVTGIPVEATDIPPLGAAVRLAFPRGIKRNFDEAQGEPRRAAEVEAMAMVQNASALLSYHNRRVNAEVSRLNMRFPMRLAR
jgi:hypothetical protein